MTVSMNGMTVLAAGEDPAAEAADISADVGTPGDTGTEEPAQGDASEDGAGVTTPDGDAGSTGSDENANDEQQEETQPDGADDETPAGDAKEDPQEQTSDENESDESISENGTDGADAQEPEAAEEEIPEEVPAVAAVQLMSFTDDVGMTITYDAVEVDNYQITVEDGILKEIKTKDGEPVSGNVVLPEKDGDGNPITGIGSGLFQDNKTITYVKLPAGVTGISENAFKGCTELKGVYVPPTVTAVGMSAFEGCTKLTKIALPKAVTAIGAKAFCGDNKLFMVYMKDAGYSDIQTIGDDAFSGCSALSQFCSDTAFILPDALTMIGARAFYGCGEITEVNLRSKVSILGESAFAGCTSLRSVTLSPALKIISREAFRDCRALTGVAFQYGNEEIGESAFANCYYLGAVELPGTVAKIGSKAFTGCTRLASVKIRHSQAAIEEDAFDVSTDANKRLKLIGGPQSTTEQFVKGHPEKNFEFVNSEEGLRGKYKYEIGELTGGDIKVVTAKDEDPNTLNKGTGVPADTVLYVNYTEKEGYSLVEGSLKCNGVALEKKDGRYFFKMPVGGALITAEFKATKENSTTPGTASEIKVDLSNGEFQPEADGSVSNVTLKVGQTSRMFLIDDGNGGKAIDSAKITYKVMAGADAVSISESGMITAKKDGKARIRATVKSASGVEISKEINITVKSAYVGSLRIKIDGDYDSAVKPDTGISADEVQGVSVDVANVKEKSLSFTLKAAAYSEDGDDMSAALSWTTSDPDVAGISQTSTAAAEPMITVTIPQGAEGEATVTAAAENKNEEAQRKKITQQFVVRVQDTTPRLVSNQLTLNPNLQDGVILEIVSAYGKAVTDSAELYYHGENVKSNDFNIQPISTAEDDGVARYRITAKSDLKNNEKYPVDVRINGSAYILPVNITVKESMPKPKVTFDKVDKKQPKIDIFQAMDKTQIPITVTGLGGAEVETFSLEPLTNSDNDKLFTESFKVTWDDVDRCTIELQNNLAYQKDSNGKSTNKPVVKGYLVLKYKGYTDDAKTKIQITVPTQTVKPSYVLSKTSGTYRTGCGLQTVLLELLDKKTKKPIDLSEGGYKMQIDDSTNVDLKMDKNEDIIVTDVGVDKGKIRFALADNFSGGTVKLCLTNTDWADNQKFIYTYKVKTTSAEPKFSLSSSSIKLNTLYAGAEAAFTIKADQDSVKVELEQTFAPAVQSGLSVTYTGGIGKVTCAGGGKAANGTYTFTCDDVKYQDGTGGAEKAKKVTLKVVVSDGRPTVSVKGSVSLNKKACKEDGTGAENGEFTLTVKNLPEGYGIDSDKTTAKIQCTTGGGYEKNFVWKAVKDAESGKDKLQVALQKDANVTTGTYKFTCTPVFTSVTDTNGVEGKAFNFSVKVHDGVISVDLSAKGKLNLLNRVAEKEELTASNSLVYTPKIANLKDAVSGEENAVKIFDVTGSALPDLAGEQSKLFQVSVRDGKLYVTPKEGAELENGKTYKVRIWMKLQNYRPSEEEGGLWCKKPMSIKTAQTLPKVQTDVGTVNLFLSNKNYKAEFVVDKKDVKALGAIESVTLDENDTKALESFVTKSDGIMGTKDKTQPIEITSIQQDDGSLKVTLQLKKTVAYSSNSTNKVKMYVRFAGQGPNTAGTAITMNVKINK